MAEQDDESDALSPSATIAAMRAGVDAIYQAALTDDAWLGRADFLRRVDDVASALGDWSYEVYDTKLARETQAGTILQLCVYSRLVEGIQGRRPTRMHVVTPRNDFKPVTYRVDDFGAYFRLLERDMVEFVARPSGTYPDPVSHCDYCSWWTICEKRRRQDDHLCYVAGISTTQIKVLREWGIEQLAGLAALASVPQPSRGSQEALARARDQARAQQLARDGGAPYYQLKEPFDVEHGLALLPAPTPDDVFLDFEGDHFAEEGVREYLIGYVSGSEPVYTALWATTLEKEREVFERFIDTAIETRRRNPGAHIYHYASYEPAALKRLMGRHATRESELDELLRGKAFVDLYTVVRRSLIAGVERYSIKELEPFFAYRRTQDLREAAMSRRLVENALAAGETEGLDRHWQVVETYNREDCESAQCLRSWLEQRRAEAIEAGCPLSRPAVESGEASQTINELDRELQHLRDGLLIDVPAEPGERSAEEQARFVLAHMMEFHRREDKAAWWEYFRLLGLHDSEFGDERRAIIGLEFERALDDKKAPLQRYRFPPQELDARARDDACRLDGQRFGSIEAVNHTDRTIDIKKRVATANDHARTVVLHDQVPSKVLRESLMGLGEAVLENGLSPCEPYRAAIDLLRRRPPPGSDENGLLQHPGETTVEAACRIALGLDGNVLAIQGPPGTGKTYTGAHVICALVRAGLKVGVTAVSHKVIVNLL